MNTLRVGLVLLCLTAQTGCIGQVLGIKRIKSGDTTIDFTTSVGVNADISQGDTLENKRGIRPDDNSRSTPENAKY